MSDHTRADRVDRDTSLGKRRRDAADEPDDGVLRRARTRGRPTMPISPASDAVQTIRPPAGITRREAPHAEHDAVDVDRERAAVPVEVDARPGRPGRRARRRSGTRPRKARPSPSAAGSATSKPGRQIERLDRRSPSCRSRATSAAPIPEAPPVTIARVLTGRARPSRSSAALPRGAARRPPPRGGTSRRRRARSRPSDHMLEQLYRGGADDVGLQLHEPDRGRSRRPETFRPTSSAGSDRLATHRPRTRSRRSSRAGGEA